MSRIQNSRNIIWIKIKLFCIATAILKVKNLDICSQPLFWFNTRVSSLHLRILTNGYIFIEATLIEDILLDVDIIISLLLFKHRIVNDRAAVIAFKFNNVALVHCVVLMHDYRITFLLDTVKLLDPAHRHLVTTQAHQITINVLFWIDMKRPW